MESKSSLLKFISALAIILLQVNAGAAFGSDFDVLESTTRKVKVSRINGRISKCHDDPTSTFFLKPHKSDPTKGIFQTCAWLKHRNTKEAICNDDGASWTDGTGPAKEVCPNTCGVPCNTDAPSPSPSKMPSSSPTMAPTTCTEDSESEFFLKAVHHNPIIPVYQTCAWLKGRSAKDQICNSVERWESESNSTVPGPAREVCLNTCNSCPTEILLPDDNDGDSDGSNPRGSGPQSLISTSDGTNLPTMTAAFVTVMAAVVVYF
uniref:ShKT domain-containing protein n=1 Tax=Chaetoceros debilis TaxID=122233 RepID=A0A7S3PZ55_9STRA|eukprot:CAMPEP_0194094824 /NCGR_PEP_ID=MMETSP0149-20130528/55643_1 /TAXON_ID=122233 /ORGANISM="Chaetoceros debilis, Strain MM31A-1" /LENGTH=262 /DNA_ID=CAMNT_0038780647 /DNA_START=143 /DNA_END=931 /DNA_ORIENTATION=-